MRSRSRNQQGFSLATVAAIGLVSGLWMLGTAAMVVPSIGRITVERARDVARSSAEAALDWGVQQLNNPETRSNVDNKNDITVPQSLLGDTHYKGSLSVVSQAPPVNSYLYDPQLDPNVQSSNIQGGNGWRLLTAVVTPNELSNGTTRTVRVILKPVYRVVSVPGDPTWETTMGPPESFFKNAAAALQDIAGVGNFRTDSYDSDINLNPSIFQNKDADVGSNKRIGLTGNSSIGGNLNVTSEIGNSNTVATGGTNVVVHENINANGSVSNFPGVPPSRISQNLSNPPMRLPAAPSAPAGAADLGTMNLAGNNVITLSGKGATMPNGQFVPTQNGSYVVNQISLSGNARINIDRSHGPVNLYVQGAGSNAGISLTGNGITGTHKPADLRIWYGGTGPTRIAGNGTIRGVLYAPNSSFRQSGNGVLYGAVVANSMDFAGNATFHYDVALGRMQDFMYNTTITQQVTNNVDTRQIDHFQAVSWDEFNY